LVRLGERLHPGNTTLKANKLETASVEVDTISTFRTAWFERLEYLHQITTENSGLECASRCTARCCPQSVASIDPADAVGHVAIMLPFEMEYLISKTNATSSQFQSEPLEIASGITIDIGFITNATPCPFLTADHKCGIHSIRPLDCRSFPLIPVFNLDGTISFRVDAECPSACTFSPIYETQLKQVWEDLLPSLPMNYRMLYNRL
jgi:Fe-S-cluster containining protein